MKLFSSVILALLFVGSSLAPQKHPAISAAQPGIDDTVSPRDFGVLLIVIPDESGTMSKTVARLAAAEIDQLRRSLRPGDFYARLPFSGAARTALLQRIHETGDIDLIAKVISENVAANGVKTALSAGLIAGRDIANKHADGRRVLLVMTTDAVSDPPDAARERRAFAEIAAWWRSRPDTTRIVVSADNNSARSAPMQTLANALSARIVTPEAFARESIIERAVEQARPVAASPQSIVVPSTETTSTSIGWVVFALVALLIVGLVSRRRLRGRQSSGTETLEPAVLLPVISSVRRDLVVRVAGQGRVNEQVLDVNSLPEGGLTLGSAGIIPIIGLPGTPVVIDTVGDDLVVTVEPGHDVRIDGQRIDVIPQPIQIGRACTMTTHGTAISLQVRRADELQNVIPLRIGGVRRGA